MFFELESGELINLEKITHLSPEDRKRDQYAFAALEDTRLVPMTQADFSAIRLRLQLEAKVYFLKDRDKDRP